jgi:acid phosphatase (class A)
MKLLAKLFLFALLFTALPQKIFAQSYLDSKSILPSFIDPPLAKNSAEYEDEIEFIIQLQKNAKKADLKKAVEEKDLTPEMIAEDIDLKLSRKNFPKLYKILDRSQKTTEEITRNIKIYWNFKRPFLANKNIKALVKGGESPSYPSKHASASYISAQILGMLIPTKNQEFKSRAEKIANNRVLVGMHFPRDLVGGRQLSFLILGGLIQNEDFLKDFESAKKELEEKYFEIEE